MLKVFFGIIVLFQIFSSLHCFEFPPKEGPYMFTALGANPYVLHISGTSKTEGAPLTVDEFEYEKNQFFVIEEVGEDYYRLKPLHSNGKMCLTIAAKLDPDDKVADITQQPCKSNDPHQLFIISSAGQMFVMIQTAISEKYLTAQKPQGIPIKLKDEITYSSSQIFTMSKYWD